MGRLAGSIGLHVCLCCAAGAGLTQEALPDFETCMDIEIARYEQKLARLQEQAGTEREFDIAGVSGVEYCGTVGIVRCDRSGDPVGCQKTLVQTQDTLRMAVLGQLPAPGDGAGRNRFAEQLYARSWALAHGVSSGPDCAGAGPLMSAWCEAREANGRLRQAVLAWQAARYLGRAATAIEAGWASPPPPVRPRMRPEGQP